MRTLLIVEDDHDTRVALREAFEAEGYCVFSAANGRDALEVLPSLSGPLLVLLDQNMPVMSGDEFLRAKIKKSDIAPIPVIVMSAVCDRTLGLGTQGYFAKPLDVNGLIQKVNTFFTRAQAGPPPGSPLAGSTAYLADANADPLLKFLGLDAESLARWLGKTPALLG
jgi:CheY-like chemotaxis protein